MYKYKKRFKEKKKIRIFPYFLYSFFGLTILFGIIYFLFFSPFIFVKEIEVNTKDNNIYNFTNNFLEKKFLGINTKSFFLSKTKKLEEEILNNFPYIDKIDIKKNIFKLSLNLEVTLREKVIIFCNNLNCYNLDRKGIIFSHSEKNIPYLELNNPIESFNLGERVIEENIALFILDLTTFSELEKIVIINERRINLKTRDGFYVYLNPEKDSKEQLEDLNLVIKKYISSKKDRLEYIDLRFEDRAYFKYKD